MKLLVIADFHGNRHAVESAADKAKGEGVDAVIVCGDLTNFGPAELGIAMLEELVGLGLPILFVPGNCDPRELAEVRVKGATNLHGDRGEIGGYVFIGVGGSNLTPFRTPFELSEDAIHQLLGKASEALQSWERVVLVTHVPPYGTKVDRTAAGLYVGSRAVRQFIESKQPLLSLCAHVHEGRGIDSLESTAIANPGPASRGFCAIVNLTENPMVTLDRLS